MANELPSAVYDLALRLGVDPDDRGEDVRLTQTGRMRRHLDTPSWIAFTATQSIATRECAFDWRARCGPLGMIGAHDALDGGKGRLDISAFGLIPVARTAQTAALLRGELMRYLGELAWAPAALLFNRTLRWREDRWDRLTVSTGAGETASEVTLSLDGDGRIAEVFARDRPRSATAPALPTPWRGRFSNYRLHKNCWIPFAAEVAWEIAGQDVTYFHARVDRWS